MLHHPAAGVCVLTFHEYNDGKEVILAAKTARILLIDDEESIRDGCSQTLKRAGYLVETAAQGHTGINMALSNDYDIILVDLRLPGTSGLDVLRAVKDKVRSRIIMITGYGTIPLSVEAMRLGAVDFLTKPFSASEILNAIASALEPAAATLSQEPLEILVGESDYLAELKETIRRVAKTNSTVLLTGESGTGKELVASTIHKLSPRSGKPYVAVDCSSLVENLMESELFGHARGAFSGAENSHDGRFQIAHTGTLFLDEISNLSLKVQAKLLRAIQEHEIPRVGSSLPEKVDVRLITATNQDLHHMVQSGSFREDLFYRISVLPIHIKPLREHPADILPIARHYLEHFSRQYATAVRHLSPEASKSLLSYHWPGNVRELKNTMERLCVLSDNEQISVSDILYYGQPIGSKTPVVDAFSGRMTLVDVEKEHIRKALAHFQNQISKTARFLGIDRKTLRMKIRQYGIKIDAE